MIIPEYGRNVQKMVDYLLTIENREERNKQANNLIEIIGNLNPQVREEADPRHKLWDHLYIMSDFKLEVDSPYPPPSPDELQRKPEKMEYPKNSRKYRHYGNILQGMVHYLAELDQGEEKEALKEALANQMKKTYLTWNKDHVDDEVIIKEMNDIAGGKLELSDLNLVEKSELLPPQANHGAPKRKYKKRKKRPKNKNR